jgi:hypothetical protein
MKFYPGFSVNPQIQLQIICKTYEQPYRKTTTRQYSKVKRTLSRLMNRNLVVERTGVFRQVNCKLPLWQRTPSLSYECMMTGKNTRLNK